MKTEEIIIENLKCGGCENTIKSKLSSMEGISKVSIDRENAKVTVEHEDGISRAVLTEKLAALGYPETGSDNGLLTKMKSYGSCMLGRISDHDE